MAKPWSKPKSWALESELAESEELATPLPPSQNFPSLKEATSSKPKKKKPAPIPLTEFYAATSTPDEFLNLPTAPRERRPEDSDRSGGFGYQRRGFEHDTRNVPQKTRAFEPDLPSRADEVSDWGAGKKPFSGFDRPRNDRYGSLGGGSRSDEVGNWAAGKKEFVRNDRYEMLGGNSKASEVDNWAAGKKEFARNDRYEMLGGNSKAGDLNNWAAARKPVQSLPSFNNGERKKLVLDPPKKNGGSKSDSRSNVFGMARPREEVLAEKGLDWKKIDLELESKTSRPSSAHSSRPGSSGSQAGSGRVKVNPFGDAKPREVVLMEKGVDYRKIDMELEHKRVDRPESEEERKLKEEISHLKSQLCNADNEISTISNDNLSHQNELILEKERELELLIRQLDDKVRFSQRGAAITRPRSRSGLSDDSRSSEFMERPQSRDRKEGFQGGFFADRNLDRPNSRERW